MDNQDNNINIYKTDNIDLGHLLWVADSLRDSLQSVREKLLEFSQNEADASDDQVTKADTSALRVAAKILRDCANVLNMIERSAAAIMLAAMEEAVQHFVDNPKLCTKEAVDTLIQAGDALLDYVFSLSSGQEDYSVGLFPLYKSVGLLSGMQRIHPADLWQNKWQWLEIQEKMLPTQTDTLSGSKAFFESVLHIFQSKSKEVIEPLSIHTHNLWLSSTAQEERVFWQLATGFLQTLMQPETLVFDDYVKRMLSRMAVQYDLQHQNKVIISEELARDTLFFIALGHKKNPAQNAPVAQAIVSCYNIQNTPICDYDKLLYGQIDPSVRADLSEQIVSFKELWSDVSSGNENKLDILHECTKKISKYVNILWPEIQILSETIESIVEVIVDSKQIPSPNLAMEVAISVLFLKAKLNTYQSNEGDVGARANMLAQRIRLAQQGSAAEPLTDWMEDLYAQLNSKETTNQTVTELQKTIAKIEQALDHFFRHPQKTEQTVELAAKLNKVSSIFAMLEYPEANKAVTFMAEHVQQIIETSNSDGDINAPDIQDKILHLSNSLGTLSFMLEMMTYQPGRARSQFYFDTKLQELVHSDKPVKQATESLLAELKFSKIAKTTETAADLSDSKFIDLEDEGVYDDLTKDKELSKIFLDEVQQVIVKAKATLDVLWNDFSNTEELTNLRRSFHTLKGSARMVGLASFGQAAWEIENTLNSWLADNKSATETLLSLCTDALNGFCAWREDIANNIPTQWHHSRFTEPAVMMQKDGTYPAPIALGVSDLAVAERISDTTNSKKESIEFETLDVLLEMPSEFCDDDIGISDTPDSSVPETICSATTLPGDSALTAAEKIDSDAQIRLLQEQTQNIDIFLANEIKDESTLSVDETVNEPKESTPSVTNADILSIESGYDKSNETKLMGDSIVPDVGADDNVAGDYPEQSATFLGFLVDTQQQLIVLQDMMEGLSADEIKQVGGHSVPLELFNTYISEADAWSRQLVQELEEWALNSTALASDSIANLAHSLTGSSAAVGLSGLASLSRAIEYTANHLKNRPANIEEAAILLQAAQTLRQSLHQFAAGLSSSLKLGLLYKLAAIIDNQPIQNINNIPRLTHAEFIKFVQVSTELAEKNSKTTSLDLNIDEKTKEPQELEALCVDATKAETSSTTNISSVYDHKTSTSDGSLVNLNTSTALQPDSKDAIDSELFDVFSEEAEVLLFKMEQSLSQWKDYPEQIDLRQSLMRLLHTFKGSARLAGAMKLGAMAHDMESAIDEFGTHAHTSEQISKLQNLLDDIDVHYRSLIKDAVQVPESKLDDKVAAINPDNADTSITIPGTVAGPIPTKLVEPQQEQQSKVQVRARVLDNMLNHTGEVITSRSHLEIDVQNMREALTDMDESLERLRIQLRDIQSQAEYQMQSRVIQDTDETEKFDPLEFDRFTRMQELARMMAESVDDLTSVQRNIVRVVRNTEDDLNAQDRQAKELQEDLLRTRMVEFDSLSDRLYHVVRQTAKETGKQVQLEISGGTIEIDRTVIDRITSSFEHLLRNAVVHGIEDEIQRIQEGKKAYGAVHIDLRQEGSNVVVSVRDDGRGLDIPRIRSQANNQGLLAAGASISDKEAAQLIFHSGLSTAKTVTPLAGRGVGMDVVRSEVNALGGHIEVQTQAGKGTEFTLILPLTTAVTQILELRAGNLHVGVPTTMVEKIIRTDAQNIEQAYNSRTYTIDGEKLPFYWAGAMLQHSCRTEDMVAKRQVVVVLRSATQRIVVHVDAVLGNHEVIIKNIGPQLTRMPGLSGITILPGGRLLFIYNFIALEYVYGNQIREFSADLADPNVLGADIGSKHRDAIASPVKPTVLVVDDSVTIRRVTERLLKREGYDVMLAANGLDALRKLENVQPHVVLSDIEMPKMDGFDLLRNIRGDEHLKDLPVIMITSRTVDKHRERAIELGATDFLGKPYPEDVLLQLLRKYTKSVTVV